MTRILPTELNILIKEEDGLWVAHCLELDIVTTADSQTQVEADLIDLVKAQVAYAVENDNLDYLLKKAPREAWDELSACTGPTISQAISIPLPRPQVPVDDSLFSLTTKTCFAPKACHA